jgi:GT2 family glycosyltransferase
MEVSIIITTHNRLSDLQRTLAVVASLDPAPLEVLITADDCSDSTVDYVRSQYPTSKLIVNPGGMGSVASRHRMMLESSGDLVLSLDDDSYPEQRDCIARFITVFENRPQLAVLCFPQHTDEHPETLSQPEFGPARLTRSFANSGAVLRRSTYLELPGFEPRFFHMYEEPDYALPCVAAGQEVYFSPVVTIRHHWSSQVRNEQRNHRWHSRNEFWSAVMRCPFPQMPLVGFYRIFSQSRCAWKRGLGWLVREPVWWAEAFAGIPYCLRRRNPVSWPKYKAWLKLT